MKRTPRIPYKNQQEIKKQIFDYLKQKIFLNPFVAKVYLLGSLVDRDFGLYEKPEENILGEVNYGSDIDLIIIADENFEIPKTWKKDDFIFEFCDLGFLNNIKGIKNNIHKIDAFVYRKSLEELPVANKTNLTVDVFNTKSRKEALNFWLKNHKNELWYEK